MARPIEPEQEVIASQSPVTNLTQLVENNSGKNLAIHQDTRNQQERGKSECNLDLEEDQRPEYIDESPVDENYQQI